MTRNQLIVALAGLTGIYQMVVASRVLPRLDLFLSTVQHRGISLVIVLLLIYLTRSARGEKRDAKLAWYDIPLVLAALVGAGFVAAFYEQALDKYGGFALLDTTGIILAALLGIALLEAVRRTTGWVLPLLIVTIVVMTLYQNYLPGLLNGRGIPLDRLAYGLYIGPTGIFGLPLGVATSIIIVMLIYARLLQHAGIGEWFMGIALALTAGSRGGPAKVSVLSSGLFGMISGSPSANVATTGALTIPLMVRSGYRPAVAGAVEAVASTGGMIMPPVMGSVVFVMSEWIEMSYGEIAILAIVPALLYYAVALASVHFEALSKGLKPLPRADAPPFLPTLLGGWFYVIPLGVLIYFLMVQRLSPDVAGMLSLPFLIGSSFLSRKRENWLLPKPVFLSLADAVRTWLPIAAITAAVGILVGALQYSGLAIRVPGFLLEVSGGNLALTLVFVGIASLVIGMGMELIPSYVTLAAIAAPALITLGLPDYAAHFYVVYWGLSSFITPPVCIAVFVACGFSGARVWETGWEAMKLGIAVYLVPFVFAFDQSLMLQGPPDRIVITVVTAFLGAVTVAAGIRGYAMRPLNAVQRLMAMTGGVLLIAPDITMSAVGLAMVALGIVWHLRQPAPVLPEAEPSKVVSAD
ncbi:MAG: TRAP transporter fused permease subunit [Chloroflexi bacterium]|nr:TRAP transporter fused permease subunit [Chloroflexota bacterium]